MTVTQAIRSAERYLTGKPVSYGVDDPRSRALIPIGEFIQSDPEPIWDFVVKWARPTDDEFRIDLGCYLLEHLFEHHLDRFYERAFTLAGLYRWFATACSACMIPREEFSDTDQQRFDRLIAHAKRVAYKHRRPLDHLLLRRSRPTIWHGRYRHGRLQQTRPAVPAAAGRGAATRRGPPAHL